MKEREKKDGSAGEKEPWKTLLTRLLKMSSFDHLTSHNAMRGHEVLRNKYPLAVLPSGKFCRTYVWPPLVSEDLEACFDFIAPTPKITR
ncbi:MAG: hypothetical protein ABIM21_01680 [candidate division WOR-3 bacterium]